MWQALYEELKELGFVVITVALDRGPEDARPWIEAARPTHPSLIDVGHAVADLYNMVNVPTVVWIDERGRIVRPNDVAFGTDTFRHITGIEAARHLGALRAWVRGEAPVMAAREVRRLQPLPSPHDQQARAEFGLGRWLAEHGRMRIGDINASSRHATRAAGIQAPPGNPWSPRPSARHRPALTRLPR